MADKYGIRRDVVWKLQQPNIDVSYKEGIGKESARSEYHIQDHSRRKSVYYGAM